VKIGWAQGPDWRLRFSVRVHIFMSRMRTLTLVKGTGGWRRSSARLCFCHCHFPPPRCWFLSVGLLSGRGEGGEAGAGPGAGERSRVLPLCVSGLGVSSVELFSSSSEGCVRSLAARCWSELSCWGERLRPTDRLPRGLCVCLRFLGLRVCKTPSGRGLAWRGAAWRGAASGSPGSPKGGRRGDAAQGSPPRTGEGLASALLREPCPSAGEFLACWGRERACADPYGTADLCERSLLPAAPSSPAAWEGSGPLPVPSPAAGFLLCPASRRCCQPPWSWSEGQASGER